MDVEPEKVKWYAWLMGAAISLVSGGISAGVMAFKFGKKYQKFDSRILRLEGAIIDPKTGASRAVTTDTCGTVIMRCKEERTERRNEDRDNLSIELKNIHAEIAKGNEKTANLERSVAAMPVTIAKELKEMGILKQ